MFPAAKNFCPTAFRWPSRSAAAFPSARSGCATPYQDLLGPGTHATTFGGTPLACAVALKILEVVEREKLDERARKLGEWIQHELDRLAQEYPNVVRGSRGIGFMLGLELEEKIPAFAASDKPAALQFVNRLNAAGVLTIPAGTHVIRLLPPLNLKPQEAAEGIAKIEELVKSLT